jgi:serine/threonine protein kinase
MKRHSGSLPPAEATKLILEALTGLAYAHDVEIDALEQDGQKARKRGVVHRDFKPHNLLLSGTGDSAIAKVGDYGLAKAFEHAGLSGLTRTGQVGGTPWFMPRQQVIDFKYAFPEVDVWAAAASLYYLLTGYPPRDFPRNRDPFEVILRSAPIPIRQRQGSLPAKLADVIDLALIDKPAIRFKTAIEFKDALESVHSR